MVKWDEFYLKLKEKVENILKEKAVFEGQLNFAKIVATTLKECLEADGVFKRKGIKRNEYKDVPDVQVLYRDDTKIDIKKDKK